MCNQINTFIYIHIYRYMWPWIRNTILYYYSWTIYCESNYILYNFLMYILLCIWQELCMYIIIEYTALVTCHVLMFARECTWMRRHTHARTRTCAYNHAFSDVLKRAALRTQRKAATLPLSFKQLFVAVFWVFVKWNASKRGVARRRQLRRRNPWRDRSGESLDRYIFTINSRTFLRLIRSWTHRFLSTEGSEK